MMTMQQAAQSALDVQDAVNLSGVLHSLDDIVMNTLWPAAREGNHGTDWVNMHPIVTLYLSKLTSLNRTDCICSMSCDYYSDASREVEALAEGKTSVGQSEVDQG
jgi:hypothetical protein